MQRRWGRRRTTMGMAESRAWLQATAGQMTADLASVRAQPKVSTSLLETCRTFHQQGAREDVREDAQLARPCKEAGNGHLRNPVRPKQNAFAGWEPMSQKRLGTAFPDAAAGIRTRAQRREEPGGKWALPGHDTQKYQVLQEANVYRDDYEYQVGRSLHKTLGTEPEKEKGKKDVTKKPIIALDAGHGLRTAGKRCRKQLDPNQTREWQLNARIMDAVGDALAGRGWRVLRVDDTTGAQDVPLSKRVGAANAAGADVYLSMHHNAGLSGRPGGGTVVYYCSSKPERPEQARKLYDAIVSRTGLRGNRSQKVIKKGFYVVKNTKMPAFLVENGFMDSPTDVPVILSEDHARKTADGVVAFLVDVLKVY